MRIFSRRIEPLLTGLVTLVVLILAVAAGSCGWTDGAARGDGLTIAAAAGPGPRSPLALAVNRDGSVLYAAEATGGGIARIDTSSGEVADRIPLGLPVSGLALSPDEKKLFVTAGAAAGRVLEIDAETGRTLRTLPAGHSPTAPVVVPGGKTLCVCNRFDDDVSVLDIATGRETARIPVAREPVAAVFEPGGRRLFVANHLPLGPADGEYTAAGVSVIEPGSGRAAGSGADASGASFIALPNGSTGLRGICAAPDGLHVYVTHILARYQLPTTQLERGWMNTNAISIIDAAALKLVNTVLLDDVDLGAANPWGAACTPDGRYLCIAHAGTHEVSVIDLEALHAKLDRVAEGTETAGASRSSSDVPNDLSFLVDLRRRLKLEGNGPRGLAVAGTRIFAAEYFSDSIGMADADPAVRHVPRSIALSGRESLAPERRGKNPTSGSLGDHIPVVQPGGFLTPERRGERLFNDATICFQQWQSCASCHPDGRTDGRNWDLLNDGMGNPRNTKSMLLAHQTPPAMITGVRDRAEIAVRSGIRHILFSVRPEGDAAAIDAYLKSLEPVPSPHLVDGELAAAARRGREIFERAGCAACHPAPLYTDLQLHDVGTGPAAEEGCVLDTPTLVECWRTAPYLIDGRATTMEDVQVRHNRGDGHGATQSLTPEQIGDLATFILSL